MTVDPISTYSNQSLGSDVGQYDGFSRQMLSAKVSTKTVGVQLGKLGVSLSTQNISFAQEALPQTRQDFAQELELQGLTQHIMPFRAAGSFSQNATIQRLGVQAYSQQANLRTVAPMISVTV